MPASLLVMPSVVALPLPLTPLMVLELVLVPLRVRTVAPAAPPVMPPPMFWVAESITMGVPPRPQVLAMAASQVATSVLVVLTVESGAAGSPSELPTVDQLASAPPPSQVWLAGENEGGENETTGVFGLHDFRSKIFGVAGISFE